MTTALNVAYVHELRELCDIFDSGKIPVTDNLGNTGGIYFEKGIILHAAFRGFEGYEALGHMLTMEVIHTDLPLEEYPSHLSINKPIDTVIRHLHSLYDEAPPKQPSSQAAQAPQTPNLPQEETDLQDYAPPCLRVLTGSAEGLTYEISILPLLIGRRKNCDITVPDPTVSGHHAQLILIGDALYLEDLNSSNGTFINENPIYGKTEVQPGDILKLGQVQLELITSPKLTETQPIQTPDTTPEGSKWQLRKQMRHKTAQLKSFVDEDEEINFTSQPHNNKNKNKLR